MKLTHWIVSSLTRVFERYGAWMSKPWSPAIAMAFSLLLCAILSSGLAFQTVTNDSEWLFTPKYNQARQTADTIKSLYPGPDARLAQVLLEAKDHGNVWTPAGWAAAKLVHDATFSVRSEQGGTYQDRCARSAQGLCLTNSPFSCTGLNFTAPVVAYPTCLDANSGAAIEVSSVIGWPTPAGTAPHQVVAAGHLLVLGYVVAARGEDSLESALHWESDWTAAMLVCDGTAWRTAAALTLTRRTGTLPACSTQDLKSHPAMANFRLAVASGRSLDDALAASSNDTSLVIITFATLVVFGVLATIAKNPVRSKHIVGQAATVSAGLAIPAAFGFMAYCGVPFTSLASFSPFLILAIGVDDGVLILTMMTRTDPKEPLRQRLTETMRESGVAITLTTLTDGIAFAVGATSPFPAVQIFCAYTATAIVLDYIFQLTFFMAVLTWDARRQDAGRSGLTCRRVELPQLKDQGQSRMQQGEVSDAVPVDLPAGQLMPAPLVPASETQAAIRAALVADLPPHEYAGKWMDKFVAKHLAPAVNTKPASIAILVAYAAMIGLASYGLTLIKQGLKRADLAPDGHYVQDFFPLQNKYLQSAVGTKFWLVFTSAGIEYGNPGVRREMQEVAQGMTSVHQFDRVFSSWLPDFEQHLSAQNLTGYLSDAQLSHALGTFLSSPAYGPRWRGSLSLQLPDGHTFDANDIAGPVAAISQGQVVHIRASRVRLLSIPLKSDSDEQAALLVDGTARMEELMREHLAVGQVELYEPFLPFFHQFAVILSSTVQTLIQSAIVTMLVSVVLIPSVRAVGLVVLTVLTILLGVLGIALGLAGTTLSSISSINLVITIGFAIDACAHQMHGYLHAPGLDQGAVALEVLSFAGMTSQEVAHFSRQLRAAQAMLSMGRPVGLAVSSTLVALIPVAFSPAFIFRTFAKLQASVLLLSLVHAVAVLPALLQWVGPRVAMHDHVHTLGGGKPVSEVEAEQQVAAAPRDSGEIEMTQQHGSVPGVDANTASPCQDAVHEASVARGTPETVLGWEEEAGGEDGADVK